MNTGKCNGNSNSNSKGLLFAVAVFAFIRGCSSRSPRQSSIRGYGRSVRRISAITDTRFATDASTNARHAFSPRGVAKTCRA